MPTLGDVYKKLPKKNSDKYKFSRLRDKNTEEPKKEDFKLVQGRTYDYFNEELESLKTNKEDNLLNKSHKEIHDKTYDKTYDKARANPSSPNKNNISNIKWETARRLSTLIGMRQKIFIHIYKLALETKDNNIAYVIKNNACDEINCGLGSFNKTLGRLCKDNLLKKEGFKGGPGGYSVIKIPPEVMEIVSTGKIDIFTLKERKKREKGPRRS